MTCMYVVTFEMRAQNILDGSYNIEIHKTNSKYVM